MFNENFEKIFLNHICLLWPYFTTSGGYRGRIWFFKRFLIGYVSPCPLTIGRQGHRAMHTLTIKHSFLWLPSLSLFFLLLFFIFSTILIFLFVISRVINVPNWSVLSSVSEPSRLLAQGTIFTLWTVKQLFFSLLWPLYPFINRRPQQRALEVRCWLQ